MYGNNISTDDPDGLNNNGVIGARAFLNERLFPWLMSQKVGFDNSFVVFKYTCSFNCTVLCLSPEPNQNGV